MEEERYVQVASRFFRLKPAGDDVPRRLHYLEQCFLCKGTIAGNRDVFMYKGDAAFCSDDCRQEQMDMDDALHAVARRHLVMPSSSAEAAASSRPPVMRRRPTIANLAARSRPVVAS
ncbi:hypothetical protein HU200_043310 [Digitaria exilis]|uniref:FLZ-type domain-containing protein n=1 Tax=Digitaria exilis TaxID=1010633 RepID=A0A835B3R0_9POAL|nr:hypothetical protein HU200_043310 [Digitaria exilis]CAB3469004.1 unnamed protein product [Digitaria exilis]